MFSRLRLIFALLLAATMVAPLSKASAEVLHLTPESQWAQVLASDALKPGDEIVFGEGEYRHAEHVIIRQHGTADKPIVIRAAEGARVLFDGGDGGRNHHRYKNVFLVEGCQHVRIQGLELTGGSTGFRMQAFGDRQVEHLTIEDCHIHHVGNCAVAANRHGSRYFGVILRGNHIHHTGGVGEGFYLGANDDKAPFINGIIEKNYIHHLTGPKVEQGDGIEIKDGSYNNIIRDNVIHDTQYPAIIVYGTVGKAPNIIERNVIWGCHTHAIQAASDAVIRNNIIFNCRHHGIHSQNHQSASPGNLTIVNNTIYASESAIHINTPREGKLTGPIVIANNALYSDGPAIDLPKLPGFTLAANLGFCRQSLPFSDDEWRVAANRTTDFVAFTKRNAHPHPDSQLIGAANAIYLPSDDFDGVARDDSSDVGAYTTGAKSLVSEIRDGFKE